MAKARCPGECGYEAAEKSVEMHMRKCADYGKLFVTATDPSLLDPKLAYERAHPAAEKPAKPAKPPKEPKPPKATTKVSAASDDAPGPDLSEGSRSGASVGKDGSAVAPPARRGARRSAVPPLTPTSASREVAVEYWDWERTLLENLRADAAATE